MQAVANRSGETNEATTVQNVTMLIPAEVARNGAWESLFTVPQKGEKTPWYQVLSSGTQQSSEPGLESFLCDAPNKEGEYDCIDDVATAAAIM